MMKKTALIIVIMTAFCSGFAFNSMLSKQKNDEPFKKVTGIGGIFFKCKDPEKVKDWYNKNLGLKTDEYGTVFVWYQGADSTKKGYTQWTPFANNTKYFGTSSQDFMIDYRVADLDALVAELKKNNVTIVDSIERYNYGNFVHILDCEGNKVQLWQPIDTAYGKFENDQTK